MFTKDELLTLSRKELQDLRNQIDEAMRSAERNERKVALEEAAKAAAKFGYSLSDLVDAKSTSKAGKSKLPAKYRNPENPEQTWSGRGRRPQWVNSAIEEGRVLEDFEV
jgi:DNA-binding protein H-NS